MTAEPTTRDFLPHKHVRAILARTAAFKTLVGASTEADALAYIHYYNVDEPINPPYAVIGFNDAEQAPRRGGPIADFSDFVLVLIVMPATGDDDAERFAGVEAALGSLREQFYTEAIDYGFQIDGLPRRAGPYLGAENERATRGDYAEVYLRVHYFD